MNLLTRKSKLIQNLKYLARLQFKQGFVTDIFSCPFSVRLNPF